MAQWYRICLSMQETQETQVWSLGWEDLLKEEIATHSSILAWGIPWTEEAGVLQPMGSKRVGHDWEREHAGMLCREDIFTLRRMCVCVCVCVCVHECTKWGNLNLLHIHLPWAPLGTVVSPEPPGANTTCGQRKLGTKIWLITGAGQKSYSKHGVMYVIQIVPRQKELTLFWPYCLFEVLLWNFRW